MDNAFYLLVAGSRGFNDYPMLNIILSYVKPTVLHSVRFCFSLTLSASNEITREPPIGGMVKQFCSFFSCRGMIIDHPPLFLNRAEVRHGYLYGDIAYANFKNSN